MKIKSTILGALLFALVLQMCGKEEIATLDDIIDPVKRVSNTSAKWRENPEVGLVFIRKIGVLESDDENYMLHRPNDVTIDSDGNIYVLDSGNFRIQKFNPKGEYLATIGTRGQGPGEFMMPSSMDIDDQGNLFVSDQKKSGVIVFTPDGYNSGLIRMGFVSSAINLLSNGDLVVGGGTAGGFSVGIASFSGTGISGSVSVYSSGGGGKDAAAVSSKSEDESGGQIIIKQNIEKIRKIEEEAAEEAEKERTLLVKLYDPEGKNKGSFCPPLDYNDMMMNAAGNAFYTAVGPDNSVYVAFKYQNRVERYSTDGELLFSADRPVNYEITGPVEDKDDAATKSKEISGWVVYSSSIPVFNEVSRGIGVDGKGRAWVMTYAKQYDRENDELPELQLELFSGEGALLGVFPWEEDFIPTTNAINVIGDRVFFLDTEGVSVYEYRIMELN